MENIGRGCGIWREPKDVEYVNGVVMIVREIMAIMYSMDEDYGICIAHVVQDINNDEAKSQRL